MSGADDHGIVENFRSSYYQTLGFKAGEKSITYLEVLLKTDIYDVKKLKSFCLKHTLTVYYRPLVWKIILSVIPVFSDKETCSFVSSQKRTEFYDLKHALHLMGKLENSTAAAAGGVGLDGSVSKNSSPHAVHKYAANTSSSSPSSSSSSPSSSSSHVPSSNSTLSSAHRQFSAEKIKPAVPPALSLLASGSSASDSAPLQEHRALSQTSYCTPSDLVTIFLLENNRLLSTSLVSQMKQEEQVNTLAIAEAFIQLFEDESEDNVYWLFSSFVKRLQSHLNLREELLYSFVEALEEVDCSLLEHIKDLDALETAIPVQRWFCQCFAKDLPESCIESVWDRVIGGSCMVLAYVAVAILLSQKRKILGFSSASQLQHLLDNIPKDNFGPIVSKAIELWEASGSPLLPSNTLDNDSSSSSMDNCLHDLIEDYT